jgi:streptogrisin C
MKRTSVVRWAGAGLLAAGVALSMAAPASAGVDTSATKSVAELSAAQVKLDKAAATRPSSVAGWYVDQASRSLVVEVHGSDAAVANWASSQGAGTVKIKHLTEAYKPVWNLIGGQAITTGGSRCSLGFNARSSGGTRYVITAGHCTALGGNWSGVGGSIGPVSGSTFPGSDYGRITVTSSAAVSTPLVDRYSSGSDVTVTGPRTASNGLGVCRSGSTTGWHCGSVTATNQTVCYSQGCVGQMIRTNVCAEPGDSGGSLVTNPGSATRVQAVGLTSGGSGNCSSGGTTFFQPITEPLSAYGLTLYTG